MSSNRHDYDPLACPPPLPSGEDVYIHGDECEVKVDVSVGRVKSIVIWGHVLSCENRPVPGALVKLCRYRDHCPHDLESVSQTYTDRKGCYQFDLRDICAGRYRVIVSGCPREPEPPTHPGGCRCPYCCDHPCPPPCPPQPPKCCGTSIGQTRQSPAYPSNRCRTTLYNSVRYQ